MDRKLSSFQYLVKSGDLIPHNSLPQFARSRSENYPTFTAVLVLP